MIVLAESIKIRKKRLNELIHIYPEKETDEQEKKRFILRKLEQND